MEQRLKWVPRSIICLRAWLLTTVGPLFFMACSLADAAESDKTNQAIVEKALQEYCEKDSFAAVEYVCAQSDPLLAAQSFFDLMRHCYWKKRDLPAALVFARAGVQHGLTTAATLSKKDPEKANALRAIAKGLAYDIASFTWPGWNEKGIEISKQQIAEGLHAARANLRLAKLLKKGSLPVSRAYWMLGAQELAAGNMKASGQAFLEAAEYAKKAGSQGEELLATSYVCVVEILDAKDKGISTERLHSLLVKLRKEKDGQFFADQVEAALHVFSKKETGQQAAPADASVRCR